MNDLSVIMFGANELGSHLMRAMTIDRSWTWKLGVRKRQDDSSGVVPCAINQISRMKRYLDVVPTKMYATRLPSLGRPARDHLLKEYQRRQSVEKLRVKGPRRVICPAGGEVTMREAR